MKDFPDTLKDRDRSARIPCVTTQHLQGRSCAGNTMAQRTKGTMDAYYRKLAVEEIKARNVTCEWKTFKLPLAPATVGDQWNTKRPQHGLIGLHYSDVGFWLNTAQQVQARRGTYELRWNPDSEKYELRNKMGRFRWMDRIDSNSNSKDGIIFQSLETINGAAEWLTGADFDVIIDWEDKREDVSPLE
jgi:hypothetical protein